MATEAELASLFTPSRRDVVYRVAFRDGEHYELRDVIAGQDYDEPAHADAQLVRQISGTREHKPGTYLFFLLNEIQEVVRADTGEVVYSAA
jgi:hypothetical protein